MSGGLNFDLAYLDNECLRKVIESRMTDDTPEAIDGDRHKWIRMLVREALLRNLTLSEFRDKGGKALVECAVYRHLAEEFGAWEGFPKPAARCGEHPQVPLMLPFMAEPVYVDKPVAPLVLAMNNAGLRTTQSYGGDDSNDAFVYIELGSISEVQIKDHGDGPQLILCWDMHNRNNTVDGWEVSGEQG